MTFSDLQHVSLKSRAVVALEGFAPRRIRKVLKKILIVLAPALVVLSMFFSEETHITDEKLYGILLGMLFAWIVLFLLDCFFYSLYFESAKPTLHEFGFGKPRYYVPFELMYTVLHTHQDDVTEGFVNSPYGQKIFARLNVDQAAIDTFLVRRDGPIAGSNLRISNEPSLASYAGSIFDADQSFANLLARHGFGRADLVAVADWVSRMIETEKAHLRWWSRDSLGRIRGIGKEWAHGETYHMEKFGTYLQVRDATQTDMLYEKEVKALERVLVRKEEANALIVGEENGEILAVVEELARQISHGVVLPQLEHKRVFLLNDALLVSATASKTDLSRELKNILEEAIRAEHIILVIPNFASFISSATALDIDAMEIMEPYLRSSGLQIVALSDKDSFIDVLQKNTELMSLFEKILISGHAYEAIMHELQHKVEQIEKYQKIFFTYPALIALAKGAERYFSDNVVSDKISDLLAELVPQMKKDKKRIVVVEDIQELLKIKTGIPLGNVSSGEKENLLNLEKVLHEKIVGQDAAVKAISNAMRRARSGIGNENRPMGSFLFLGPTGVGKTETTKALADVFFGSKAKILRFDMSEYNSDDSLNRLIGSFESGKAGTLATALRENPYGVLLLDEFEKSSKKVLDLFLQIIDEGFFSDMRGRKVNARNVIIIATSNAGSDMVWKLAKEEKDISAHRDEIIDTIIAQGTFKPELMNRFDGIVLFHPLSQEHLKSVARLLLSRLVQRLKEKGIELVITEELIGFLVKKGTDPKFGARPINRAIQENVEEIIAKKMISGEIKAGSRVELRESDLM